MKKFATTVTTPRKAHYTIFTNKPIPKGILVLDVWRVIKDGKEGVVKVKTIAQKPPKPPAPKFEL